jgi:hypothetical protein
LQTDHVAETLQRGDRRGRDGRRLLKGQAGGLDDHGLADAHVLGEGAAGGAAEHLVTGPQVGDGAADGGNGPSEVGPGYRLLWSAQPHRRPGMDAPPPISQTVPDCLDQRQQPG